MVQTLPRWRVTVTFEQVPDVRRNPIVFHLSDNYLQNVMQKVAALDFGLDVVGVEIQREVLPSTESGLFVTTQGWAERFETHAPQGQWLGEPKIGHGGLGAYRSTSGGSRIK